MPLSHFQLTESNKDDTFKLIQTINLFDKKSAISDKVLTETFEVYWPKLENEINKAPIGQPNQTPVRREESDVLEEVLLTVRKLAQDSRQEIKGQPELYIEGDQLFQRVKPDNKVFGEELGRRYEVLRTEGESIIARERKNEKYENE